MAAWSANRTLREFRPSDDPRSDEDSDWADNAVSNSFAWASHKFLPAWCQTPEHWTSRFTGYMFTTCPCCLLFRGIIIGMTFTGVVALAVAMVVRT